ARHPPGTGRGSGEPRESGLYSAVRAHRRPRSAPTMSGLPRRMERSRPADAGEPPVEGTAAVPESGAAPQGEPAAAPDAATPGAPAEGDARRATLTPTAAQQ